MLSRRHGSMAYLFDTDAISELFRKRPSRRYLEWLAEVPRDEQFTSAVCIGELYRGAFSATHTERHLTNIEDRVLPGVTVLPYDVAVARVCGEDSAALTREGRRLADADLQIASTALHHGLELVTGNIRHFGRVEGLRIQRALADSRTV